MALVVKNLPANAGDARDAGLIPGSGRSLGKGNGNPLQDSCLKISMNKRSLKCYSPWEHEEWQLNDGVTEHTHYRMVGESIASPDAHITRGYANGPTIISKTLILCGSPHFDSCCHYTLHGSKSPLFLLSRTGFQVCYELSKAGEEEKLPKWICK